MFKTCTATNQSLAQGGVVSSRFNSVFPFVYCTGLFDYQCLLLNTFIFTLLKLALPSSYCCGYKCPSHCYSWWFNLKAATGQICSNKFKLPFIKSSLSSMIYVLSWCFKYQPVGYMVNAFTFITILKHTSLCLHTCSCIIYALQSVQMKWCKN